MRHQDLPERWQRKLQAHLLKIGNEDAVLSAFDFPLNSTTCITFEDGSKVAFRYAFIIEAPELREIGLFTEHCGYHVFPFFNESDLVVEIISDIPEDEA